MLKALYGILVSLILYYKNFREDIEGIVFQVNPYDICVANQIKSENQQTVTNTVDYLIYRHVVPKINDKFVEWCEETYVSDNLGHVKVARGKIHDYLGMIVDFTQEGALNIDMKYYIKVMLKELPYKIKATQKTLWTDKLLKIQENTMKLDKGWRIIFPT